MITKVLEAKHELERIDKIKSNGWNTDEQCWAPLLAGAAAGGGGKRGGIEAVMALGNGEGGSTKGWTYQMRYHSLLRTLEAVCPPGFKFRLGFVKISNADPKEVRKAVLSGGWGATAEDVAKASLRVLNEC